MGGASRERNTKGAEQHGGDTAKSGAASGRSSRGLSGEWEGRSNGRGKREGRALGERSKGGAVNRRRAVMGWGVERSSEWVEPGGGRVVRAGGEELVERQDSGAASGWNESRWSGVGTEQHVGGTARGRSGSKSEERPVGGAAKGGGDKREGQLAGKEVCRRNSG